MVAKTQEEKLKIIKNFLGLYEKTLLNQTSDDQSLTKFSRELVTTYSTLFNDLQDAFIPEDQTDNISAIIRDIKYTHNKNPQKILSSLDQIAQVAHQQFSDVLSGSDDQDLKQRYDILSKSLQLGSENQNMTQEEQDINTFLFELKNDLTTYTNAKNTGTEDTSKPIRFLFISTLANLPEGYQIDLSETPNPDDETVIRAIYDALAGITETSSDYQQSTNALLLQTATQFHKTFVSEVALLEKSSNVNKATSPIKFDVDEESARNSEKRDQHTTEDIEKITQLQSELRENEKLIKALSEPAKLGMEAQKTSQKIEQFNEDYLREAQELQTQIQNLSAGANTQTLRNQYSELSKLRAKANEYSETLPTQVNLFNAILNYADTRLSLLDAQKEQSQQKITQQEKQQTETAKESLKKIKENIRDDSFTAANLYEIVDIKNANPTNNEIKNSVDNFLKNHVAKYFAEQINKGILQPLAFNQTNLSELQKSDSATIVKMATDILSPLEGIKANKVESNIIISEVAQQLAEQKFVGAGTIKLDADFRGAPPTVNSLIDKVKVVGNNLRSKYEKQIHQRETEKEEIKLKSREEILADIQKQREAELKQKAEDAQKIQEEEQQEKLKVDTKKFSKFESEFNELSDLLVQYDFIVDPTVFDSAYEELVPSNKNAPSIPEHESLKKDAYKQTTSDKAINARLAFSNSLLFLDNELSKLAGNLKNPEEEELYSEYLGNFNSLKQSIQKIIDRHEKFSELYRNDELTKTQKELSIIQQQLKEAVAAKGDTEKLLKSKDEALNTLQQKIDDLDRQLAASKTDSKTLDNDLKELEQQEQEVVDEIAQTEIEIKEIHTTNVPLTEQYDKLDEAISDLSKEIGSKASATPQQTIEMQKLENTKKQLFAQLINAKNNVDILTEKKQLSQQTLNEIREKRASMGVLSQERQASNDELQKLKDELQQLKDSSQKTEQSLQTQLADLQKQLQSSEQAKNALATELATAKNDAVQLGLEIEALKTKIEDQNTQIQKLSQDDPRLDGLTQERDAAKQQLADLQKEYDEKVKSIEQLNTQIEGLQSSEQTLNERLAQNQIEIANLTNALSGEMVEKQKTLTATNKQLTQLRQEISVKDAEIKQQKQSIEELEKTHKIALDEKSSTISALESQLVQKRTQLGQLQSELQLLQTEKDTLTATVNNLRNEIAKLEEDIQVNKQTTASADQFIRTSGEEIKQLTLQVEAAKKQIEQLTKDINSAESAIKQHEQTIVDLQQKLQTATSEKSTLDAQLVREKNEVAQLRAELQQLQTQLSEKKSEIQSLTTERDFLKSERDTLSQAQSDLTLANAGLQKQIKQLEAKITQNDAEILANEIKTNELQTQLKTKSGGNLTLQTEINQLKQQNEYLTTENNNLRSEIKTRNEQFKQTIKSFESAVTPIIEANQKKSEEKLNNLVTRFTAIEQTLANKKQEADKLQQSIIEKEANIEQLEQTIVQLGEDHQKAIDAKDAKITEIEAQLQTAQNSLTASQNDLAEAKQQLKGKDVDIESLTKQKDQLEAQIRSMQETQRLMAGSESTKDQAIQALTAQNNTLTAEVQKLKDVEKQNENLTAQIEQNNTVISENEEKINKLEAQLTTQIKENAALKEEIETLKNENLLLKAANQQLLQNKEDNEAKIKQLEDKILTEQDEFSTKIKKEIDALQEEINAYQQEIAAYKATNKKFKATNEKLSSEKDNLIRQLGELEKVLNENTTAYSALETKLKARIQELEQEIAANQENLDKLPGLESELKSLTSALKDMTDKRDQLQNELNELNANLRKEYDLFVKPLESSIKQLRAQLTTVEGEKNTLENANQTLQDQIQGNQLQIQNLNKQIEDLTREGKAGTDAVKVLQQQVHDLTQKNQTLNETVEQNELKIKDLKDIIDALENRVIRVVSAQDIINDVSNKMHGIEKNISDFDKNYSLDNLYKQPADDWMNKKQAISNGIDALRQEINNHKQTAEKHNLPNPTQRLMQLSSELNAIENKLNGIDINSRSAQIAEEAQFIAEAEKDLAAAQDYVRGSQDTPLELPSRNGKDKASFITTLVGVFKTGKIGKGPIEKSIKILEQQINFLNEHYKKMSPDLVRAKNDLTNIIQELNRSLNQLTLDVIKAKESEVDDEADEAFGVKFKTTPPEKKYSFFAEAEENKEAESLEFGVETDTDLDLSLRDISKLLNELKPLSDALDQLLKDSNTLNDKASNIADISTIPTFEQAVSERRKELDDLLNQLDLVQDKLDPNVYSFSDIESFSDNLSKLNAKGKNISEVLDNVDKKLLGYKQRDALAKELAQLENPFRLIEADAGNKIDAAKKSGNSKPLEEIQDTLVPIRKATVSLQKKINDAGNAADNLRDPCRDLLNDIDDLSDKFDDAIRDIIQNTGDKLRDLDRKIRALERDVARDSFDDPMNLTKSLKLEDELIFANQSLKNDIDRIIQNVNNKINEIANKDLAQLATFTAHQKNSQDALLQYQNALNDYKTNLSLVTPEQIRELKGKVNSLVVVPPEEEIIRLRQGITRKSGELNEYLKNNVVAAKQRYDQELDRMLQEVDKLQAKIPTLEAQRKELEKEYSELLKTKADPNLLKQCNDRLQKINSNLNNSYNELEEFKKEIENNRTNLNILDNLKVGLTQKIGLGLLKPLDDELNSLSTIQQNNNDRRAALLREIDGLERAHAAKHKPKTESGSDISSLGNLVKIHDTKAAIHSRLGIPDIFTRSNDKVDLHQSYEDSLGVFGSKNIKAADTNSIQMALSFNTSYRDLKTVFEGEELAALSRGEGLDLVSAPGYEYTLKFNKAENKAVATSTKGQVPRLKLANGADEPLPDYHRRLMMHGVSITQQLAPALGPKLSVKYFGDNARVKLAGAMFMQALKDAAHAVYEANGEKSPLDKITITIEDNGKIMTLDEALRLEKYREVKAETEQFLGEFKFQSLFDCPETEKEPWIQALEERCNKYDGIKPRDGADDSSSYGMGAPR